MFCSGVFWMGLVFIPVTSLVFDVAYKVWVSLRSLQDNKGKIYRTSNISLKKFLSSRVDLWRCLVFCPANASRNIHNIAALTQVDPSLQQFLHARRNFQFYFLILVKDICVSKWSIWTVGLWKFRRVEASVAWQDEEGVFQDPGGWSAGAGSFIQRPRSSGARKEVLSGATSPAVTLDLDFTPLSEPRWLRNVKRCNEVFFFAATAHAKECKMAHRPHMCSILYS